MLLKFYLFISIFLTIAIIFSYYTIISIFSLLLLLIILCSILFFLNIEFIGFLILFIYLGGILIFFIFASLMLNMQFVIKQRYSYTNINFICIYLILGFKSIFFILYFLIKLIDYYIISFNNFYFPLTFNANFNLIKTIKIDFLSVIYNYHSKVFIHNYTFTEKFGPHLESYGLLLLYENKGFLLILIGLILFTVLVIVSTLLFKKNVA
jgi:NADH:ubiquinone oxidoreductase subunit 6 (subunit J)